MHNLNYGYAPGLALQVSGVNKVFWSGLNRDLLLLLCSWLLDRLNDQLVDSFVRGVYTNKKNAMQQLGYRAKHKSYDAKPKFKHLA